MILLVSLRFLNIKKKTNTLLRDARKESWMRPWAIVSASLSKSVDKYLYIYRQFRFQVIAPKLRNYHM
jgi:hypothetical protein